MDWFMGKSKKKDKEATTPTSQEETKPYLDDDFAQERFLDVDFMNLVTIPHDVDHCEWLATHTKSFFEHVNLMYGCLAEYCQTPACSSMTGPGNLQYQWIDDRGKKNKCTAPQYIDYVMSFSQKCIYDETVFPTKYGNVFPATFETTVKKINRLLLHVFAHVYQSHSRDVVLLKLHGHLNTVYYHFHMFNRQFSLVDDKEMEVLDDLYARLHHHATHKVQFDASVADETGTTCPLLSDCSGQTCVDESHKTKTDSLKRVTDENKENVVECGGATYPSLTLVT